MLGGALLVLLGGMGEFICVYIVSDGGMCLFWDPSLGVEVNMI